MLANVNMALMLRRKRSYHHGDLRRALMDAAIALVAETGSTAAATLREVARRAGVSHNAPSRHFEDKGALLAAIAEEGFVALIAELQAARGASDAAERFAGTGVAYLTFARRCPAHLVVMFGPELAKARTTDLQRLANDAFQIIKAMAGDAGILDAEKARQHGVVIWSYVHGLASLVGRHQVPPSVHATPDELGRLGLQHLFRSFEALARDHAAQR